MKTYRRFIAMLLAGVLFLSCVPAHAMTTTEKENNYNAAILQLEAYLESYGNDSTELLGIAAVFEDLHGYAKSTSFVNYISALIKISNEEYDYELDFLLSMLEVNEGFNKYLEEMRDGSSIGTIDELEAYARAREYEHDGNAEGAMENYRQCMDFFDAQNRYKALSNAAIEADYTAALNKLQAGDFAGAYFAFSDISRYGDSTERMKAIVMLLGYTPKDASDNLKPVTGLIATRTALDQITISWQESNHAQQYEVYYKETNQAEWKHAADTSDTTLTVTGLKQGTSYDFKVVAAIGRLKADEALLRNQQTASATPTPKPTPKPTPTPTPTPKPTPKPTPTPTPTLSAAALGFTYEKVSANTVSITKYTGSASKLMIPDQLDGYRVVAIDKFAFSECSNLISVIIPTSVTNIGNYAFYLCVNMTSITIPNSVTSIGSYAFYGCSSLTSVTIPNSVTSIGKFAFYDCSSLTSVTISNRVTRILDSSFSGCNRLTSVTIPNSVTSIDNYAFSYCDNLTSVSLPNNVTSIGSGAFQNCSSLTSVTIPNSVTSIGREAFFGCKNPTIYGSSNSEAERYAKANGIPFARK